MSVSELDLERAHKECIRNRKRIERSTKCGCFYCLKTFAPTDITEWVQERTLPGETAICPHCGIDAVLGDSTGVSLSTEFLTAMHAHWFKRTVPLAEIIKEYNADNDPADSV